MKDVYYQSLLQKEHEERSREKQLKLLSRMMRFVQREETKKAFAHFNVNVDSMTHDELVEIYNIVATRLATGQ